MSKFCIPKSLLNFHPSSWESARHMECASFSMKSDELNIEQESGEQRVRWDHRAEIGHTSCSRYLHHTQGGSVMGSSVLDFRVALSSTFFSACRKGEMQHVAC